MQSKACFRVESIDPEDGLEYLNERSAGMAKLVDAPDSKSGASNGVPVRLRLPVHFLLDAVRGPVSILFDPRSFSEENALEQCRL